MSIASRFSSSCGIRADGSVECWGGGIPSPPGEFVSYDIGAHGACGVTTGLEVVCQSSGFANVHPIPRVGPLTALSIGATHQCGIRPDGSLLCWGGNPEVMVPPGGAFRDVSAGRDFTCALRTNGAAVCRGMREEYGQTTPPGTPDRRSSEFYREAAGRTVPIPTGRPEQMMPLFFSPPGSEETAGQAARSCGQLCSALFWYEGFTLASVRTKLDLGADPALAGDEGGTALHWAAGYGAGPKIVQLLLDHGADVTATDSSGSTILHWAMGRQFRAVVTAVGADNNPEALRTLLRRGADANQEKNNRGETPLSIAVRAAGYVGGADTVRLLLEHGADASTRYHDQGFTILHLYYLTLFESSSSPGGRWPRP